MHIIVYKDEQYGHDKAVLCETMEKVEEWAEDNRSKTFRVFMAQEYEVNKKIQLTLIPNTRSSR